MFAAALASLALVAIYALVLDNLNNELASLALVAMYALVLDNNILT